MSSDELAELQDMGPVDYVILEWPEGRPTPEIAPMILDLVDRGLMRILDIAFIAKDADGSLTALDLDHLEGSAGAFADFEGASSGLLDFEDLQEAGAALKEGSSAAVVVYENLWLAPLAIALRRSGALMVANGRVPVQALLAAIDALEAAT
jgi:hypothetical protein